MMFSRDRMCLDVPRCARMVALKRGLCHFRIASLVRRSGTAACHHLMTVISGCIKTVSEVTWQGWG